ncbi:MAG TPA: HAMP domain-containing sensor histidine kinase [Candidatus Paceibacterota bacterium]|nr:HAMP domain-containing sensor histidine kinase [Candidatus Paceibacterota bacterium]
MAKPRISLRPFAAWVTDLRHRYGSDLFFRTTVHVVALQVGLVIALGLIFAVALRYTSRQVIAATVINVVKMLQSNATTTPIELMHSVDAIHTSVTIIVFGGILALATITGFAVAYITLHPAREALVQQKKFISNVAHELRTPLSIIKTTGEVALFADLAADTRDSFVEIIAETDRATEIVTNLLSLNQVLRPERIEFGSVDFCAIVESSTEHLMGLAQARGITLTVEYRSGTCVVWGNASALEQVATNIIRNSISYMDRDRRGAIDVSVESDGQGSMVLTVADNGIGIARDDLLHIFEPFYRADSSRARQVQVQNRGSGLGLAIVNEIVRLHRGKIRMQSAPGHGTTTYVSIPSVPGTPAQDADKDAAETVRGENEIALDFSRTSRPQTPYFDESPKKES